MRRLDDEPVADPADPVHADPRAHGQLEVRRVRLEVVGLFVLRREPSRSPGNGMPGSPSYLAGVNSRRESQRRRHASPIALVRVQDHEVAVLLRQVVGDRQPGLPAADDDGVEHAAGPLRHRARLSSIDVGTVGARQGSPHRVNPPNRG